MESTFYTFSTDIFRRGSNNIKCEVNLENFYPGACKFSFFFCLYTALDISHTVVYIGKCVFFISDFHAEMLKFTCAGDVLHW